MHSAFLPPLCAYPFPRQDALPSVPPCPVQLLIQRSQQALPSSASTGSCPLKDSTAGFLALPPYVSGWPVRGRGEMCMLRSMNEQLHWRGRERKLPGKWAGVKRWEECIVPTSHLCGNSTTNSWLVQPISSQVLVMYLLSYIPD